jgi:hypothetical protein
MIADDKRGVLISSMGWVDGHELWVFDARADTARRMAIGSEAKYLMPRAGTDGHFSVAHHFDGPRFDVTVHTFADPSLVLGRASVTPSGQEFTGDLAAWTHVPRLYVAYNTFPGFEDFSLFRIDAVRRTVMFERLGWYDDRYDKGYQGIVSVTECRHRPPRVPFPPISPRTRVPVSRRSWARAPSAPRPTRCPASLR